MPIDLFDIRNRKKSRNIIILRLFLFIGIFELIKWKRKILTTYKHNRIINYDNFGISREQITQNKMKLVRVYNLGEEGKK